jgi:uncharacterized protein YndB with AHSA1/START domain
MSEENKSITIETTVNAPVAKVWQCWNSPEHIRQWAFASDDWEAPYAENDLREGGRFKTTMASKDGNNKFDLMGTYNIVKPNEHIEYIMDGNDQRKVVTQFEDVGGSTRVIETFDMENENSEEMQRGGWQSILNNFKKHVEAE